MSAIVFDSVTFYYESPLDKIFDGVTLNIDTGWKLGVVGRNGRGKTTLLNLISGNISPVAGKVSSDIKPLYFPYLPKDPGGKVLDIIKDTIAPFRMWEEKMEELLAEGSERSLPKYGEILEKYQDAGGYEIDALIEKEVTEIHLDTDILQRPFDTLSGGERTKVLLIPLFLKKDFFPLIDEPTNHLDIKGRETLGEYLSKKSGFILVSHDRHFLDLCTDHILSINKSDVRINKGNYSQWKYNIDIEKEFEKRKNENLKREIRSLEESAKRKRAWSVNKEKEKKGAYDKGYIGHRAAKMMKRALNIEKRVQDNLEEKKSLLKNLEKERNLKLDTADNAPGQVLSLHNVYKSFGEKNVLQNFSLTIYKGDRIAVTGPNGCGKTSLFKIITGELKPDSGSIYLPGYISISYARQIPLWSRGYLREHIAGCGIDETRFRNIMGAFGAEGELFERPLETFSRGELKKVELCRSFLEPSDLLIWDEPVNYIDIASREQIEKVILASNPTIIFVEHDRAFIEEVATDIISLN